MADLSSGPEKPANSNEGSDDLLSILKREADEAIHRIAKSLQISSIPKTGLNSIGKYRLVCQAYEARRARPLFFASNLFAEPAWDILLAMFREYLAARPTTVADVVRSSDVQESSARRWLSALIDAGLVEQSEGDLVALTSNGVAQLDAYIQHLHSNALMRVV
ncbi:helix-turn-helix domain-containing protein [Sphingomonas piscis]|uniref:Helix-turn-helix domain-containing protein n=1 Tax=Sphingomonas piscis TaxID=2714943 RepID=A0A6G7YQ38_9SPHN|nr:helix-turn-helix domain-containing protein [Sphingomonas piscis]QIK78853.1 helix-turn-helix domain-containing protein [Sphingomonas piscis]